MNDQIQYGPGKKRIVQLLRRASHYRALRNLMMLFLLLAAAVSLRLFAFEPVELQDASMQPELEAGSRFWICKLPICVDRAPFSSLVLAESPSAGLLLRWQLGKPGDQLIFGPVGRVQINSHFWIWRREQTVVDEEQLRVPRAGDTLFMDSLQPMAFDFAARLYRKQWPEKKTWVEISLWSGDTPLPLSEVGRTTIANRPVAQNEVAGLPWQELRLLEMQLQRLEASAHPVRFHRRLFADSVEVKQFPVREDCWFLACGRGHICVDSREEGFFRRSELIGAPLPVRRLSPLSPIHQAMTR